MLRHRLFAFLFLLGGTTLNAIAQCPTSGTITSNCSSTNLTITGSTLTVNSGVIVTVTGTLTLNGGSTLTGTGATFNVGALSDGYGTLNTINGGTYNVSGNVSAGGGGSFTWQNSTANVTGSTTFAGSTVTLQDVNITNTTALTWNVSSGVWNGGTTNVTGTTSLGNNTFDIDDVTLTSATFSMNVSSTTMDGVDFDIAGNGNFDAVTITDSEFDFGGTLSISSGTTTADNSIIRAGTGYTAGNSDIGLTMNGGGILRLNNRTQMNVVDSVVNNELHIDNSDVTISGGFDNQGAEVLTVTNNGTIRVGGNYDNSGSGNTTASGGGVLFVDGNFDNTGGGNANATGGGIVVGGSFDGTTPTGGGNCNAGGGGCCGSVCGALPITLLTASMEAVGSQTQIDWITSSEENNAFFTVYRSTDNQHFIEIGQIAGSGNSQVELAYSFTDPNPAPGINYYRLTQTDYDGTTAEVVTGSVYVKAGNGGRFLVYPSRLTTGQDATLLVPNLENGGSMTFLLVSTTGQQYQVAHEVQGNEIQLKLSELHLSSGLYVLQGMAGSHPISTRLWVD